MADVPVLELPLSARYQKPMANHPIFFDASGRRAARIKVVAWAVGIAVLVILVGFATSLALSPPIDRPEPAGRARDRRPEFG